MPISLKRPSKKHSFLQPNYLKTHYISISDNHRDAPTKHRFAQEGSTPPAE